MIKVGYLWVSSALDEEYSMEEGAYTLLFLKREENMEGKKKNSSAICLFT